MKFDLISDIHIDHWVRDGNKMFGFIKGLLPDVQSNTLIIPGDIGNQNEMTIYFIGLMRQVYKNVLLVLGNHDFYVHPSWDHNDSLKRVREFRAYCQDATRVTLLEGQTVEIDGAKIGGTHMWYDGKFAEREFGVPSGQFYALWRSKMNDSRLITFDPFLGDWIDDEKERLAGFINDVDIVVTHVQPNVQLSRLPENYRNALTGAFSVDVGEIPSNVKYWLFGHTHVPYGFQDGETYFACNPLGYPNENPKTKIIQLEI